MLKLADGGSHPTVPPPHSLNCRPNGRDTSTVVCGLPALANHRHSSTISAVHRGGGLMMLFRNGNFQFGLLLATALSVSMWPAAAKAYTPEQEQACTPDAFRLCGAEIPDVGRVTACMVAKKSQLSPACRAHFRPDGEPREAVARPMGRQ